MESALPLLLFLGCLFGCTILILVCGYKNIEEQRAQERERLSNRDLLVPQSFFGGRGRPGSRLQVPADLGDALVEVVERYLRDEQLVVQRFIDEPSAERLHVHSQWSLLPNDSAFERVERHLSRERLLAEQFASNPTVERLHGRELASAG